MVRTSRPLVERMTLVWHDWFATSDAGVDSQRLMLNQNQLLREHALGAFPELLAEVTKDPAMLLFLNGTDNSKRSPNENYGREMLELFTLGAGRGYTESDVRENARALTGFRNDWRRGVGSVNFRYDPNAHDTGTKTIFHHAGRFTWKDSVRLASTHPSHPSFFVRKLWSYFVPVPADDATERALEHLYVSSGRKIKPVVAAILKHPALYEGPRMVKSPAVFNAGLLASSRPRRRHDGIRMARRNGGAASLLSAERRRLGRLALARHRDVAWTLVDCNLRAQAVRTRSGQGNATLRRAGARRRRAPVLEQAGTRRSNAHGSSHIRQGRARRRQADRVEAQAVRRDDANGAPAPDRRVTDFKNEFGHVAERRGSFCCSFLTNLHSPKFPRNFKHTISMYVQCTYTTFQGILRFVAEA